MANRMLTGSDIRDHLAAAGDSMVRSKPGSTDRQINTLLLAMWQLVAELDEIRFTLRKFAPPDTSAESTT